MPAGVAAAWFRRLVMVFNVAGLAPVLSGVVAAADVVRRAGVPSRAFEAAFWPVELWVASILISRLLLRRNAFNGAAFVALLPLIATALEAVLFGRFLR